MRRKVIYVSFVRLTDKVSRDWYIDYLIEKGATVEYWDIISLVREDHSEHGAIYPDGLRTPRSFSQIEELLHRPENRDAIYVMLISYTGRTTKIFRMLSKHDCRMVFINWGAMPISPAPRWRRVISHLANPLLLAQKILDKTKAITYRNLKLVKPFDIVFAAGKTLLAADQNAVKVIPVNLCDYDHYMRVKFAEARLVKGKYAVFLDINLPYQSDLALYRMPAVNPDNYYQSLNRFFGLVESEYGVKVVIAAHPKSGYNTETFQKRETYRLLTAELVRDADFVMTHNSTALSYAVLNCKPVIFIYTDDMMSLYKGTTIKEMRDFSKYLNSAMYNIDQIVDGRQVLIEVPNRKQYEDYKYSFLTTHETENTATQEIFWREINAC